MPMSADERETYEQDKRDQAVKFDALTAQIQALAVALGAGPPVEPAAPAAPAAPLAAMRLEAAKREIKPFDISSSVYTKPRDFIFRMERFGNAHNVAHAALTEAAVDKLSGTAQQWYNGRFPAGVPTPIWTDFRAEFLRRFAEALELTSTMDRLQGSNAVRLQQASPDAPAFDTFLNEFESCLTTFASSATFPLPHEEWLVNAMWWGLHAAIRDKLASDRPRITTRALLVERAKAVASQFVAPSVASHGDDSSSLSGEDAAHVQENGFVPVARASTSRPHGRARHSDGTPKSYYKHRPDTRKPGARPRRAYRVEVAELKTLGDEAYAKGDEGVIWQGRPYIFDEFGELYEYNAFKD